MATHAFASLQYCKGDVTAALDALLQSLRLWTRAVDTLARLNPTPSSSKESDPFDMGSMKDALTGASTTDKSTPPAPQKRLLSDGLEWRLSEGLLNTLFSLTELYFLRGSPREAEYFIKQATELAKELNAPSMISRALTKKAEIHLYIGQTEEARAGILQATEVIKEVPGVDAAYVQELQLEYNERHDEAQDAGELFDQTVAMLEDLNAAFQGFDSCSAGARRSSGLSRPTSLSDTLAPNVLASLFRKQLWNLRDEMGDVFDSLLEKLLSLSSTSLNKAEENALMAKLTLHNVYGRFRTDLFLSSLTESTIAVPMGMLALGKDTSAASSADIMEALGNAEKLLWSHLQLVAMKGNVVKVRQAALSLALIQGFRTSLGDKRPGAPIVMAGLLDNSVALGLRREMIETIDRKFPEKQCLDDMQWPLLSADGDAIPRSAITPNAKFRMRSLSDSEEEDEEMKEDSNSLSDYWQTIRMKYQNQCLDLDSLSTSETASLPSNWTVISINVTEDKSTLFVSRQEGGSDENPLIFCVPLNGRRDQEDEDHLSFDAAKAEMIAIIEASDACIKNAGNVKDNQEATRGWWKERTDLDSRIRQLLESMEYCWLGGFKAILNPRARSSDSEIAELRTQFEKVFHRALHVKEKRTRGQSTHKKSISQPVSQSPADLILDDFLVRCFSTLSPKCRDEEFEDVIYFILDLYQFHGVPIAIAEVDVDRLVIDLRAVLEEHSVKTGKKNDGSVDEHVFLVLDKNVQGFPWESIPSLRGRSVSRIPGVQFLHDRLTFAKWKRESLGERHEPSQGAAVDPRKGYYILNPSGDLVRTEERFRDWTRSMAEMGWDGVSGKPVSEQQFVNALKTQDLVVYFGHGGGEQYIRSHKIRSLPTCAATMLWGCSSGALREMGDFDRTGTPHNYMLAGCPTLVANLWDVTDKDIDKFSQSVFDKLPLNGKPLSAPKNSATPTSLVTAVAQSREFCKLKYLTGAAPIVYGIPFYL
ncbi:hypothetical protein CVT24_006605 [Panaeolus cyanescens]|uniref:separase n=1 Tax=Panaeolus cyanescens TaxID=181874 RepID=A0A409WP51_9AGAR|nr:hypothetical protein CVT24_006605 [Panaeolus cyanescens]